SSPKRPLHLYPRVETCDELLLPRSLQNRNLLSPIVPSARHMGPLPFQGLPCTPHLLFLLSESELSCRAGLGSFQDQQHPSYHTISDLSGGARLQAPVS